MRIYTPMRIAHIRERDMVVLARFSRDGADARVRSVVDIAWAAVARRRGEGGLAAEGRIRRARHALHTGTHPGLRTAGMVFR